VNLTQPFHANYEGDTWELYKKISKNNPVPFSAFLRKESADILSFSPERFLFYEEGKLLTSPIKGTIRRSSNAVEEAQLKHLLRSCEKNRSENVMIVDLLRNDLGKIAQAGSVNVTHLCELQSYKSVHHLVSTIEAQCLSHIAAFDAFLSCFPGGSITGAPKIESMHIIDEQEPYARGVYCGAVGYFSRHARFDTNIAIRTLIARNNLLHLAAGGGLVIDSDCED
jgi:para-aminobenzoate synthetase component 1